MSIEPIRLRLPPACDEATVRTAVASARFVTLDARVVPAKFAVAGGDLICLRSLPVGGRVTVAWPVGEFGPVYVSTATVVPREEPPALVTELARGTLGPLRDLLGQWEVGGWRPPEGFAARLRDAHDAFAAAACGEDDPAAAETALAASVASGLRAVAAYGATAKLFRDVDLVERVPADATDDAVTVKKGPGDSRADTVILESSTADGGKVSQRTGVAVSVPWSRLEPSRGERRWDLVEDAIAGPAAEGRSITCGPLIDFREGATPGWLAAMAGKPAEVGTLSADFVESFVARFGIVVKQWEVAAAVESASPEPFSDETRLALAMGAVRSASGVAGGRPLTLRVTEPDGFHLADPVHRASPFEFVDAMLRGGAPLASLTLDFTGREFVTAGGRSGGEGPRYSPIELLRTVESWRRFDVPLRVACDGEAAEAEGVTGTGEEALRSTLTDVLRRCGGVACVELDRTGPGRSDGEGEG